MAETKISEHIPTLYNIKNGLQGKYLRFGSSSSSPFQFRSSHSLDPGSSSLNGNLFGSICCWFSSVYDDLVVGNVLSWIRFVDLVAGNVLLWIWFVLCDSVVGTVVVMFGFGVMCFWNVVLDVLGDIIFCGFDSKFWKRNKESVCRMRLLQLFYVCWKLWNLWQFIYRLFIDCHSRVSLMHRNDQTAPDGSLMQKKDSKKPGPISDRHVDNRTKFGQ